jgi:hypothetical protein
LPLPEPNPNKEAPPGEERPFAKRYAVFTDHPEYLDDGNDSKTVEEKAPIVGGGLEEDDKTDAEDDQSTEDIDKNLIKKLETPVIYFIANNEYTNNQPVVMWGIKQNNRFVAL